MKLCLIRPSFVSPFRTINSFSQGPSLGLALIAAQVQRAGHEISVIDCLGEGLEVVRKIPGFESMLNGLSLDELIERVPRDVQAFGITMMFSAQWFYYETLVDGLKRRFPDIPIIIGGEHVTAEFRNIYRTNSSIDFSVLGEGEETIVDLLNALESGRSPETVRGIAFRRSGEVVVTPPRVRIKKIDELPLPLWEAFPMRNYLDAKCSHMVMNRRAMPILASRGCPYACTFCTNKDMWGTELQLRDPEKVVEEIKILKSRYDIEHLDFCDPVGVLNRKWIIRLLTLLRDEKLGVTWAHGAGTRSEVLDEEVLRLFKESGGYKVIYAPESGSEEALKRMKKAVNLSKLTASMKIARKIGLPMKMHIMYGNPGQTLRDALKTVLFGLKLAVAGVDDVSVHIFAAHPGTKDFRDLVDTGKIPLERIIEEGKYGKFLAQQSYLNRSETRSWSDEIPAWMLTFLQWGTYLSHYAIFYGLRPWQFVVCLKRAVVDRRPIRSVENVLFRLVYRRKRQQFADLEEGAVVSG